MQHHLSLSSRQWLWLTCLHWRTPTSASWFCCQCFLCQLLWWFGAATASESAASGRKNLQPSPAPTAKKTISAKCHVWCLDGHDVHDCSWLKSSTRLRGLEFHSFQAFHGNHQQYHDHVVRAGLLMFDAHLERAQKQVGRHDTSLMYVHVVCVCVCPTGEQFINAKIDLALRPHRRHIGIVSGITWHNCTAFCQLQFLVTSRELLLAHSYISTGCYRTKKNPGRGENSLRWWVLGVLLICIFGGEAYYY